MDEEMKPTRELVITSRLTWGEYKILVNPEFLEIQKLAIIERHIEGNIDDVPVADVLNAVTQLVGAVASQKK